SPKIKAALVASFVFCVIGATVFLSLPEAFKKKIRPSHITLFEIQKPPQEPQTNRVVYGPQPEFPQTTAGSSTPSGMAPVPPQISPPKQASPAHSDPAPVQKPIAVMQPVSELGDLESENVPADKFKGFVYRAFTFTNQIETVSPQLRDKILALGGKKAGEVDLGWRKRGGRYFHFTIPESSYEELVASIQAYGPVRIQKDPHPRVMPEGQIRFILWLEDRGRSDITPNGPRPESEPSAEPETQPRTSEEIAP
ncbi:MAG: hypothetical protein K2X47_15455, partial [Bdellovibrionales bacterium]|nr:hypothetical protein [Bdellovibrionales bacterium]